LNNFKKKEKSMTTNFAQRREIDSPWRIVASEVMAPANRNWSLRSDADEEIFLRRTSRRMRRLQASNLRRNAAGPLKSVLLVEDDACNRELIEDIFRFDGIPANLVTAASAEESLTTVMELQPVLILMDLKLPGMDGIEATRILKRNAATEHIPIWAVTCLNHRKDIERGLDAGCDGYVTKPIRRSEFVFRLLSLWDGPAQPGTDDLNEPEAPWGPDYWPC
jgi:two-component system, cell cycle response regulator DivK